MAGKSDYLENKILDAVLGGGPNFTWVNPIYIGVFTAMPNDNGVGGAEPSAGSGYARVSVNQGLPGQWTFTPGGTVQNAILIAFPTATVAWGSVIGFGVFDAAVAGNLLYFGTLGASQIINAGDNCQFALGAMTITET